MPKRRASTLAERRYADVRFAIATAARDLFLENNSTSVTVDAIAQQAGVSVRTFHRHFAAKEDVVSPLFERSAESLVEQFDACPGGNDVVAVIVGALTAELADDAGGWRQLLQLLMASPEYRLRWEYTEDRLIDSLADLLARSSIYADDRFLRRLVAQMIFTASRAAYMEWLFGAEQPRIEDLRALHIHALTPLIEGWRPRRV
ncbi:TetR family transcriptional regulator [Rhodococcus sp. CX]|uniref:TetR/AcrR family transcriptional regulator n=1 Tax=Rhodococcus sp. CX TaxID=2789880 RepID=UPI0018CE8245|nr:TetR/AcrR family transcriptional regulator [Rhodococcus sp. CX]MBH0120143.1 TetR family transcriptional regulator [Rhodococcus sp. CX]